VDREYFTNYCGRAPYSEIWLEHSGAENCLATIARTRARVRSVLVLGAATGEVLEHFESALGVRSHGCEISHWAHARIPARHRARVARADMRRFVPRLARERRRFDLIFCNALIYLPPRDVPAVLASASRIAEYFHFYSSTSEDHEPGDRHRVTLRPRAWWRRTFIAAGWAPTRSRYWWRSVALQVPSAAGQTSATPGA
jgi:hypothetical protein